MCWAIVTPEYVNQSALHGFGPVARGAVTISTPLVNVDSSATTLSTCTAVSDEPLGTSNATFTTAAGYIVASKVTGSMVTPESVPTDALPAPVPLAVQYASAAPASATTAMALTRSVSFLRLILIRI